MNKLTDEQCDEFRRLPGSFNDMVRAIYQAGMNKQRGIDAKIAAELNCPQVAGAIGGE